MPTLTTIAVPEPATIEHPENNILLRSPKGVFFVQIVSTNFSTGNDSPVNEDSTHLILLHVIILASA